MNNCDKRKVNGLLVIEDQIIQGGITIGPNQHGSIIRNCTFVGPFPDSGAIQIIASEKCVIEDCKVLR